MSGPPNAKYEPAIGHLTWRALTPADAKKWPIVLEQVVEQVVDELVAPAVVGALEGRRVARRRHPRRVRRRARGVPVPDDVRCPGNPFQRPFRLKLKLLAKKGAYQPGLRSPPPSASSAWSDAKELTKTVWSSRLSVACHQRGGK